MGKAKEITEQILHICDVQNSDMTIIAKKAIEIIDKELEVLEIIKKKNVNLKDLKLYIQGFVEGGFETIEMALRLYNWVKKEEEQLTLEELLKLKQWLEEIENETK